MFASGAGLKRMADWECALPELRASEGFSVSCHCTHAHAHARALPCHCTFALVRKCSGQKQCVVQCQNKNWFIESACNNINIVHTRTDESFQSCGLSFFKMSPENWKQAGSLSAQGLCKCNRVYCKHSGHPSTP